MRKIVLLSAIVLCFLAAWQLHRPTSLRIVLNGWASEDEIVLLQGQNASFQSESWGLRLRTDENGLQGLLAVYRYHCFAADLSLQNLLNAETLRTADGTPYRRQWAVVSADGVSAACSSDEDFRWVYDPVNPNAMQEGAQKGYVAHPTVSVPAEAMALKHHRARAETYARALQKIADSRSDLVICTPDRWTAEPLSQNCASPPSTIRFDELLRQLKDEPLPEGAARPSP